VAVVPSARPIALSVGTVTGSRAAAWAARRIAPRRAAVVSASTRSATASAVRSTGAAPGVASENVIIELPTSKSTPTSANGTRARSSDPIERPIMIYRHDPMFE
jgi:hypothetical protein